MAKAGDKKRLEENKAHLQKLKILIAVANAVFVGSRMVLRRDSSSNWHLAALALTSIVYAVCYSTIAASLAPHYSESGDLINSGADLKTGGMLSYFHDVLYVALFCQILGGYTNYAWLAFLSVPAYAFYQIIVQILLPWWNAPEVSGPPESEADRKRREKHSRQTARHSKFAAQRR